MDNGKDMEPIYSCYWAYGTGGPRAVYNIYIIYIYIWYIYTYIMLDGLIAIVVGYESIFYLASDGIQMWNTHGRCPA